MVLATTPACLHALDLQGARERRESVATYFPMGGTTHASRIAVVSSRVPLLRGCGVNDGVTSEEDGGGWSIKQTEKQTQFTKATRKQSKLRLALTGPSSGKT